MRSINRDLIVAPQFPDGEIVNAFLMRVLSYSGSPSLALACRLLLNRRPGLDGMPSSLGKFHEELGHLYGDIDTLIDKHTDYNFVCCGLPRHRFAAQRARLIEMYRGPVRLCRLPLLFSRSENCYLQCPACEEEQKKEFGFAFIHRRMGAPFVTVCPIHGISLRTDSAQRRLFDARCQSQPNSYQTEKTMELGERIAYCMETPAGESKYHKNDLVQLLKNSSWIDKNDRLHGTEFHERFSKFFIGAFADDRLEIMCQSDRHVANAIRALRRPDKALHPEWCVLFKWFAEEQLNTNPTQPVTSQPSVLKRKKVSRPKVVPLRETIDAELVKHGTLHEAAKGMKISVPLLSALCKRHGVIVNWRPKTLTGHLPNQIRQAFVAGMVPAEVAEKFNISASSAYRQLAALNDVPLPRAREKASRLEADKVEWLRVGVANPGVSRNALRKAHRALWMRLYRNAKDWLEANQPPKCPPTNGAKAAPSGQLLSNLNRALGDAVAVCTAPDGKRTYMSHARLRALTGVTPYALKSFEANGSVDKLEEPRSEFIKARIARILPKVGRPIDKVAVIAQKAGLRTETVRKALKK